MNTEVKNNDSAIGTIVVALLALGAFWYFGGFSLVLPVAKWIAITIAASLIQTAIMLVGGIILFVVIKRYFSHKKESK